MPDLHTEFTQIKQATERYLQHYTAWQQANLEQPCSSALTAVVPIHTMLQQELRMLNLTTPQAQYARCLLEDQMTYEIKVAKQNAKVFKNASLTQFYAAAPYEGESENTPEMNLLYEMQTLKLNTQGPQQMSTATAERKLAEECERKSTPELTTGNLTPPPRMASCTPPKPPRHRG